MKKLLLIAGLLAGSVMFANAQILTKKSPDKRVAHQMKALQKNLNLDAAQAEKINTILLARATKVDSLKANTADKKANRQAIKGLMQSSEEQVNAVLTADQQKTYVQLKESRKGKMKKRGGDQTTDTPPTKG
jgi:protein CpxP